MKSVLTVSEQQQVRQSAQILTKLLRLLWDQIQVGISGYDLVVTTWAFLKKHNCQSNFYHYQGFPAPICVSVNSVLIHGIPNRTPFQAGDVVSVDAGVLYQNQWHSDAAFTRIVSPVCHAQDKLLVQTCAKALQLAIGQLRPHMPVGTLSYTIGNYIQQQGFFCPEDYTGHAIGRQLHMRPFIPNFGIINQGPLLQPGLVICIEPMVMADSKVTEIGRDGWTVRNSSGAKTAHFEAMILIKSSGVELLTPILI